MKSATKPRLRGRPRKILKRPRGRPKAQVKRKVGRPHWDIKTDPDRFAIVAAIILNRYFELSERQAAEIARDRFELFSRSIETLRWKARKTQAMRGGQFPRRYRRRAELEGEARIKSNLWIAGPWYKRIWMALFATICKLEESLQHQKVADIRNWAELAGESDYAEATLVPLALSGFGLEPPVRRIQQLNQITNAQSEFSAISHPEILNSFAPPAQM